MTQRADRERDLSAEEVKDVPEATQLPEKARVLTVHSYGTYDGTRFDGIDPSALYDCWFTSLVWWGTFARVLSIVLLGVAWIVYFAIATSEGGAAVVARLA